jgi:hypothetical protein
VSTLAVIAGVMVGVAAAAVTSSRTRRAAMVEASSGPGRMPLENRDFYVKEKLAASGKYDVDALNTPVPTSDPRIGNPFEKNEEIPRYAVEAYQPRGISDATVPKRQYIEVEDEPWHSTCKDTVVLSPDALFKSFGGSLPFVEPEEALILALSNVENKEDAKKAVTAAKAAGARDGSKAMESADKVLKAFETSDEAGVKARPKAPKKAGATGKGWDGMKRAAGGTHSTAGFV